MRHKARNLTTAVESENENGAIRFEKIAVLVALIGVIVIGAWLLTYQHLGLAPRKLASDFYDAQARSWFQGKWSMPASVLGIEGIKSASGLQMYFGPFPSLLRVPILLITDRFDGRLTQPSIFLAYCTYLVSAMWLWRQIRSLIRTQPVTTKTEAVCSATALMVVGVGSVYLVVLAANVVYLEAIAWGASMALLALACLVSCLRRFRVSTALGSIAATTCAVLSRVSVGSGPLLALWLVAIVWMIARVVRASSSAKSSKWRTIAESCAPTLSLHQPTRRQCALWSVGAIIPTASYVVVNYIRFGTFASIPWSRYIFYDLGVVRRQVLDANGGSLTGFQFLPTTSWNYFRPDGFTFDSKVPWISFPQRGITRFGNVMIDTASASSSITASMPLLLLLAIVGIVATYRRRQGSANIGAVRVPLFGAAAGLGPFLLAGFLAHRYMADAMPFLVIGAFVGFQVLYEKFEQRLRRKTRAVLFSVAAVLALWSVAANISFSLQTQKLLWPSNDDVKYEFIAFQYKGRSNAINSVEKVPDTGYFGQMIAVGDCEALLWSPGFRWTVLEGFVSAERWSPEPWMKFLDFTVRNPATTRDTKLCRQLLKK